MEEDLVPFGSSVYLWMLALLIFARGMDILSTWVATPHMVLEANPLAKKMGWKYGIPINVIFSAGFAFWPLPALVISTTSILVAARNFQNAWLMRSMGEEAYRAWHVARLQETRVGLYLLCLLAQTGLTALVGVGLIVLGDSALVPMAIGWGIICYAFAVVFYTT